jgi:hypothetical protein
MDADEKMRVREEQKRIEKAKADREKEPDPILFVEFRNEEDPPTEGKDNPIVSFTYQGKKYSMVHGQKLELPTSVVDHLNNLAVPIYGDKEDPVTGQVRRVQIAKKNRFACVPVARPKKQQAKK